PEFVRFQSPGILKSDGGKIIHYKSVVVASGTKPFIPPPFDALEQTLHTSDTIFDLTDTPKRLAVIGAGVIGLELGQAFAALQSDVTVFNVGDNLSVLRDPEVASAYEDALRQDVTLYQNSEVQSASEAG